MFKYARVSVSLFWYFLPVTNEQKIKPRTTKIELENIVVDKSNSTEYSFIRHKKYIYRINWEIIKTKICINRSIHGNRNERTPRSSPENRKGSTNSVTRNNMEIYSRINQTVGDMLIYDIIWYDHLIENLCFAQHANRDHMVLESMTAWEIGSLWIIWYK